MRHIVATLIVAVMFVLVSGAIDVHGQDSCSFVGGFDRLRGLVGSEKVGACLEDEHFNADNGNTEQRTTGGLMVWRKADNFTAFTDGGTTWVIGPDGLQSRPNSERFSWESDPVTLANSASSSAATATPTLPTIAAPASSPSTGASSSGSTFAAVATPTLAAAATSTSAATPTKTPTKTATPTPAVTVKITDKPDSVDTGSDAHFEAETNLKKGTCTLYVTYNNKDETPIAQVDVEDEKCEITYNIPKDTKTGKAKAKITVNGTQGTASADDDFDVNKGDAVLGGSVDMELEVEDAPDDVKPGGEVKISIKTHLDKKGTCEAYITWPKSTTTPGWSGGTINPDGDGKCSWKTVAPTDFPKKVTATLTVVIRKKKDDAKNVRTYTKEFDVKV